MAVKQLGHSRSSIDRSTLSQVAALIPAIEKIENATLRDAVALTWAVSWKDSDHESLEQVPDGPGSTTLLEHVNGVNDRVDYLLELAEGRYGLELDHDVVWAAVVLHDVDKPLLWASGSGETVTFRPGRSLRDHGVLGAELAELCGVPEEVCRIVRGHSMYSDHVEERRSPAAVILQIADGLTANLTALAVGAVPEWGLTKLTPAPF